jgi:flagellar hook assembly protein FlgD
MNWSEYKAKKGKTADFTKKEVVTKKAVKEVKDSEGLVVVKAETEQKKGYVVMVEKRWDASSGEKLDDQERKYSLSDLESEKKRYDNEMARAKAQSDGLALAIEDFKKL